MQRFILRQNVENFRRLLDEKSDEAERRTLQLLLIAAQRDLAFLDAALDGLGAAVPVSRDGAYRFVPDAVIVGGFQAAHGKTQRPSLAVDPGPGLHIIDMNDAYARATLSDRAALIGRPLFEAFPDNPDDPTAEGVSALYTSLRTAGETGRPHVMAVCRYDVRDGDGKFVQRYWNPSNTPVFDDDGRLLYLLHQVDDVTGSVVAGS